MYCMCMVLFPYKPDWAVVKASGTVNSARKRDAVFWSGKIRFREGYPVTVLKSRLKIILTNYA